MAASFTLALTALQVVVLLLGIVTNGFMLGVNLSDWKGCRSLTASDYFICAVGFSNLSLQIWSGFGWFCDLFWNFDAFCRSAYALKMISIQSSLTVSGLLCVFYCTRILTFNHTLFRVCQRHFLKSYRQIIIICHILCVVMGSPLFFIGEKYQGQNKDLPLANDSSIYRDTLMYEEPLFLAYRTLVLAFGYTIPLALTIGSASLIITSLLRHMNRIRDTLNTKNEAFIDAHLCAGFTVLSLLVLFVMYFITAIINIIEIFKVGEPGSIICQLVSMLYAPAHSVVLIRGNSKLKKASANVLERMMCVLKPKGWIKENTPVYIAHH
ncbi:PREDICTED: taste receptor type 2 member 40-like [Nanorana parkeri]|uniref:taste receptor type 2 member 40-like n=1 Tax=Nanorana parkeri TaxID=125878 RepID=UPI00085503B7|nr:PREDICTED: taste receptor type 2 member 40-like [Nanorana parkeri]